MFKRFFAERKFKADFLPMVTLYCIRESSTNLERDAMLIVQKNFNSMWNQGIYGRGAAWRQRYMEARYNG